MYNTDYKSHELWGQVFQLAKQGKKKILRHTLVYINSQEIKRDFDSFPDELLFSQLDYM
jgi:hypothetical protein